MVRTAAATCNTASIQAAVVTTGPVNRITVIVLVVVAAALAGVYFFRASSAPETPDLKQVDTSTSVLPLPPATKVEEGKNVPLIATQDASAPTPAEPRPTAAAPVIPLDRYADTLGTQKEAFTGAFASAFRDSLKPCLTERMPRHERQIYNVEVHTTLNADSVVVESIDASALPFEPGVRACLEKSMANQVLDLHAGAELMEPRHVIIPMQL